MANQLAAANPEALRISIDTKAKVKIGAFSRGGKTRANRAPEGLDHDYKANATLVPFGILNLENDCMDMLFGTSAETSDFIVDGLEIWWDKNKACYPHVKELVINLDNGPSVSSNRTQFIRRMVAFSNNSGLAMRLVYYPPYHSKYNPIERCWGVLERHWNGTILNSVEKAIKWASSMAWKGVKASVNLLEKTYERGITLTKKEMESYQSQIKRSEFLPKWDVQILPQSG
jgi:transposase